MMAKHLFMCSLATCISPLEKYLFRSFAHIFSLVFLATSKTIVAKLPPWTEVRIVGSLSSSEEFIISPQCLPFRYVYGCLEVRGIGETTVTKRGPRDKPNSYKEHWYPSPSFPTASSCSPFLLLSPSDSLSSSYLVHKQYTGPVSDLHICRRYYHVHPLIMSELHKST